MGRDGLAEKVLFSTGQTYLHAEKFLPLVGRLDNEGAAHHLTVDGHVLMACEEEVKIQLLTDAIGHIFMGGGQHAACGEIPLKAAVVDAHRQVHPVLQ